MQTQLLQKIKAAILATPLRFNMDNWVDTADMAAPCGTTACIAGWAVLLTKESQAKKTGLAFDWRREGLLLEAEMDRLKVDGETAGLEALGLSYEQGTRLFHVENWPLDLAQRLNSAQNQTALSIKQRRKIMAQVAAERIERFIASGGEE